MNNDVNNNVVNDINTNNGTLEQPVITQINSDSSSSQPVIVSTETQVNSNVVNVQPAATSVDNSVQDPTSSMTSSDPGAGSVVNENLKSVEIQYNPPSKLKVTLLIFMFLLLVLFVIFLPDISDRIELLRSGGQQEPTEIIDGILVCDVSDNTVDLDKKIVREFYYTDKKLQSAVFTTTIRGDSSKDKKVLDEYFSKCDLIKESVNSLNGVNISCNYTAGTVVEKEKFDFKQYDSSSVKSAYVEAGVDIVEYDYGTNIDDVMVSMRQSGFSCTKKAN